MEVRNRLTVPNAPGLLPTPSMNDDRAHREEALDEALRFTFPASDPIAVDFVPPAEGVR